MNIRYQQHFRTIALLAFLVMLSIGYASPNFVNLNEAKRYRFHADHKQIQSLELMVHGIIVDETTTFDEAVVWATPLGYSNLLTAGFAPVDAPLPLEPDWWNSYPTAQQVCDSLVALAARHPQSARIDTIGYSGLNRPLVAITVGNNINQADYLNLPGIMLIGTIHGNEKPGTPLLMNFAEWLLDSSATDSRISRLMSECRVHILPLMNPDGYTANRRQNNAGVDLNRSFPCKTTTDSLDDTTGRAPETQAVMMWSHQTKPLLGLNFHTGSTVVNYPFDSDIDAQAGSSFPAQPDKDWFIAAADSYAVYNPTLWANNTAPFQHGMVNGVTWYQANGGLQDYHTRYLYCRHMTIEISTQQPPPASALAGLWNDNKFSILAYCSLIWQGVDVNVDLVGAPIFNANTFGDLMHPGLKYQRLGTSRIWRFLLPPGSYQPRIYRPYDGTTWLEAGNPSLAFWEAPDVVTVNTLTSDTKIMSSGGIYGIAGGTNPFEIDRHQPNRVSVPLDSCIASPFEDLQQAWYPLNNYGWFGTSEMCEVAIDSFGSFTERNWILNDTLDNGVYFPITPGYYVADGGEVSTRVISSQPFASSNVGGSGTALQYTVGGRSGGGFSDSPAGYYSNNLNNTYTFPPDTVSGFVFPGECSAFMRYSFSYLGNMEKGYDYWTISVRQDSGAFVPVDTISGIYTNWTMWYHDFPLTHDTTIFQLQIRVRSDATINRDGYTMDDFTCSMSQYINGAAAPEARLGIPKAFSLTSYPNPFNSTTRIALSLPKSELTKVTLYDVLGRQVMVLGNGRMSAGNHVFQLNDAKLTSGVFFLRASQGTQVRTRKIVLLR